MSSRINNPTPHINRSRVRRTALELVLSERHGFWKPTRVGIKFFRRIEYATREAIRINVHNHPSKGKTLL
jgi:hypothetical protein